MIKSFCSRAVRACCRGRESSFLAEAVDVRAIEAESGSEAEDGRRIRTKMMVKSSWVISVKIEVAKERSLRLLIEHSVQHVSSCSVFEVNRGKVTGMVDAESLFSIRERRSERKNKIRSVDGQIPFLAVLAVIAENLCNRIVLGAPMELVGVANGGPFP